MARFQELNSAYKEKFGFPFILAVRNASKAVILGAFERRIHNTYSGELAECLTQVHKIAWMRLRELVDSILPASSHAMCSIRPKACLRALV